MPFPIRSRAVLHGVGAALVGGALAVGVGGLLRANFEDTLPPNPLDPAIGYFNETTRDPIGRLRAKLEAGELELAYQDRAGYLASLLEELDIDLSAQVAVFSKTSLQAPIISPSNPRTIFFNDEIAVAWMRGGFIEIASQDPQQGVIFYALAQEPNERPHFVRMTNCLGCHEADLGVAGMLARTQVVSPAGDPLLIYGGDFNDHRTAFDGRWGGWYVTGIPETASRSFLHLGNTTLSREDEDNPAGIITPETISVASLTGKFDTSAYLSPYSDVAALLVFDHQMHLMNLLIRAGWEARVALAKVAAEGSAENRARLEQVLEESAQQVADYMLFAGEAALPASLAGGEDASGFRAEFPSRGPFDSTGRSLREFDLETRLMRYPLSYMIYSPAFEALPDPLREAIYGRLWDVLSGKITGPQFAHLDEAARTAIIEIVQATKTGLPDEWSVTP